MEGEVEGNNTPPNYNDKYSIDDETNKEGKSFHIAPMLHVSTPEFRNFFRLLTKRAILWTEMVVDETIVYNCHHGPEALDTHLHCEGVEHPVICQIGGIDTDYTATATKFVVQYGYDGIDLNMDCPSNRVSGRNFGAILMKDLDNAVAILQTMKDNIPRHNGNSSIPISVKCRIGIDDYDSWEFLVKTITKLSTVCQRFTLHARKCILKGLSPKENRIIPPLNYPRVYEICRRFPNCQFVINGGIPGLKVAKQIMYGVPENEDEEEDTERQHEVPCSICNVPNGSCTAPPTPSRVPSNLKGCMLGRAAWDHPAQFWDVDRYFFGCSTNPCRNRRQLLQQYCHYLERTYPRRCCDNDNRITNGFPSPKDIRLERPYCEVCKEFFLLTNNNPAEEEGGVEEQDENENENINNPLPSTSPCSTTNQKTKMKISSAVMDRSLKPVLGIFFGLPGSKYFRRACDVYSRDMNMRNCGPAFVLRKAIQVVPSHLLDQDFIKTEDLQDDDIPIHVSPLPSNCCNT